jgi:uncharacterized repeat protein (TIGR01451 family)
VLFRSVISGTLSEAGSTARQRAPRAAAVQVGDRLTYTLTLTNTNSMQSALDPRWTMHGVVVTATLPTGVTFVSASPTGYTGAPTLTWRVDDLAPGAVWHGQVVAQVTSAVGAMTLAAASTEQSPVAVAVAAPPWDAPSYNFYLPVVFRQAG